MKNDRVKPKVGNVLFNILAIITVISVGFVAFNLLSFVVTFTENTAGLLKGTCKRICRDQ